jgi:HK97 family phage major capsid protein
VKEEKEKMTEIVMNQSELAAEIAARLRDEVAAAVKAQSVGVATTATTAEGEGVSFGDFLKCVATNDVQRLRAVYKSSKALDETTGASGGFLVPTQFEERIRAVGAPMLFDQLVAAGRGPLMLRTNAAELALPVLEQDQAPNVESSALVGGVRLVWREQSADVAESEPRFEQRIFRPHAADAYVAASTELITDAPQALEDTLVTLFGRAYAVLRARVMLRGTGVGQPRGIVGHPATISVARSTTGTQVERDTDTILAMIQRLLPGSATAVWIAHPFWRSRLMATRLAETLLYTVNGQSLVYGDTLAGIPIAYSEHLPAVAEAGSLVLADLSYYAMVERAGFSVAFSEHVRFLKRQSVWLFGVRIDGAPLVNAPLILADGAGTNTVSPFVEIAAGQ